MAKPAGPLLRVTCSVPVLTAKERKVQAGRCHTTSQVVAEW